MDEWTVARPPRPAEGDLTVETKMSSARNTEHGTHDPQVFVEADAEDAGTRAANLIGAVVAENPTAVIGVATGSSPLAAYAALAARVASGELDFSRVTAFALDEYVGMGADDPHSYAEAIRSTVTEPLRMGVGLVHLPDGNAHDPEAAAAAYDRLIAEAGGIDVQILGIGSNGHLGFNEPGSSFDSRTRVAPLAEQTRADNARFFASPAEVPTLCITQGLGTILEARRVVLLAQGAGKAEAIARALEGPVTTDCPASILQRHPDVTVILDAAAARLLTQRESAENRRQFAN